MYNDHIITVVPPFEHFVTQMVEMTVLLEHLSKGVHSIRVIEQGYLNTHTHTVQ